ADDVEQIPAIPIAFAAVACGRCGGPGHCAGEHRPSSSVDHRRAVAPADEGYFTTPGGNRGRTYEVSPDGQRFLISCRRIERLASGLALPPRMSVLRNTPLSSQSGELREPRACSRSVTRSAFTATDVRLSAAQATVVDRWRRA